MVKPLTIAAVVVLCIGACWQASRNRGIVGSWYYPYTIDATPGVTFKADHMFTIWNEGEGRRDDMMFGTWQIEGDEVVMQYKEDWSSRQTTDDLHRDFTPFERRWRIDIVLEQKRAQ
jgi:hypothetical protein